MMTSYPGNLTKKINIFMLKTKAKHTCERAHTHIHNNNNNNIINNNNNQMYFN